MFIHDLPTEAIPEMQGEEFLPPISAWSTLGGMILTGAFGISLLLAAVIRMPLTARVAGKFQYEADSVPIQTTVEGTVESLHVQVGDQVNKDDVLARLRITEREESIKSLEVERDRLEVELNAQLEPLEAQLASAQRIVDKTKAALEDPQSQLRESRENRQALMDELPDELSDELEAALSGADVPLETQIQALRDQLAQQQDQVKQVRAQISGLKQRVNAQIQAYDEKIALLKELQEAGSYIKAEKEGIVTALSHKPQVFRGETFAEITPLSDLVIQLQVPPDKIPNITSGSQASVRVQGCPYTEYGVLKGEVAEIKDAQGSNSPLTVGARPGLSNTPTPSAVGKLATIEFEQMMFGREGMEPCELEAGMVGQVDVVYDETSILRWLLHKMRVIVDL